MLTQSQTKTLTQVVSKMLNVPVEAASHKATKLKGGTLGDVRLVVGMAETANGDKLPYKVVLKTQEKWTRAGDPNSWRREYDLYMSDLGAAFPVSLCWPTCYHAEMDENKFDIWLEYVDGISGSDLTSEMLEKAAFELGRFQSKMFSRPEPLKSLSNFGDTGYLKRDYEQWHTQTYGYDELIAEKCPLSDSHKQALKDGRIQLIGGKSFEYSYLRSDECAIPQHLKQMITGIDDEMDDIFNKISELPVVLCHRDFWIENIIFVDGKVRLIDWDTAGWGYLGEDLASLIADEVDFDNFDEYCKQLVPAYYNGISQHMDISYVDEKFIREMILIKFGYRLVQNYMFANSDGKREDTVNALQKIHDADI